MSVRSNVERRGSETMPTEVERKKLVTFPVVIYLRIEEGRFMSVRSNVERRVSEEMPTEVERKLPFPLSFISG